MIRLLHKSRNKYEYNSIQTLSISACHTHAGCSRNKTATTHMSSVFAPVPANRPPPTCPNSSSNVRVRSFSWWHAGCRPIDNTPSPIARSIGRLVHTHAAPTPLHSTPQHNTNTHAVNLRERAAPTQMPHCARASLVSTQQTHAAASRVWGGRARASGCECVRACIAFLRAQKSGAGRTSWRAASGAGVTGPNLFVIRAPPSESERMHAIRAIRAELGQSVSATPDLTCPQLWRPPPTCECECECVCRLALPAGARRRGGGRAHN